MTQNKKNRLLYMFIFSTILLTSFGANNFVHAIAEGATRPIRDHNYYFEAYNVKVTESPSIETEFPHWAAPDPDQTNTDLSYRVNQVLPYEQHRSNQRGYIIYPKHGVITPLIKPNAEDQNTINNGDMFDHYRYLDQGALYYFGKSPDEGVGNMVVAAHSSFRKDSPGLYKTVFQTLPISQPGDKIFVYIRNDESRYDFYEYTINASYETNKYDVSILKQDVGVPTLTTYGCYIIGSNKSRRVNVGTITDMIASHGDLSPDKQYLVKQDSPEHAVADEQASVQPRASIKPSNKPSLAMQLAERSIAVDGAPQNNIQPVLIAKTQTVTVPKPQINEVPAGPTPQIEPQATIEPTKQESPKLASGTIEKPKNKIPLTFRIKYQKIIYQFAYSLFKKSIRSKTGIRGTIAIIEKLKTKYEKDEFKRNILEMLIEELNSYL